MRIFSITYNKKSKWENMKYFKYPYMNIAKKKSKLRFKNLDKKAQRNSRINDAVSLAFFALNIIPAVSLYLLTKYLARIIENKTLETFMIVGMVVVIVIVPIPISIFLYSLVAKHLPPSRIGDLTLLSIQETTIPLKKFYGINDPKTVTKCYKCSKACFDNKDITIFLHNGKIRITIDFDHSIKDFGCYEFSFEEASFYNKEDDGLIKTFLKVGDTEFILGKRAKTFLTRHKP